VWDADEQRNHVCLKHPREANFKENIIDHLAQGSEKSWIQSYVARSWPSLWSEASYNNDHCEHGIRTIPVQAELRESLQRSQFYFDR
jgi:hypothetical protein